MPPSLVASGHDHNFPVDMWTLRLETLLIWQILIEDKCKKFLFHRFIWQHGCVGKTKSHLKTLKSKILELRKDRWILESSSTILYMENLITLNLTWILLTNNKFTKYNENHSQECQGYNYNNKKCKQSSKMKIGNI